MDVIKALRELYEEKKRLDSAIAALEARSRTVSGAEKNTRSRRGRRFMNPEEREEVSRRMSRYWALRRASRQPADEGLAAEMGGGRGANSSSDAIQDVA